MERKHDSVMTAEVMEGLSVGITDVVVDATVGGAGHFGVLLAELGADGTLVGIDEDAEAIGRAREVVSADRREGRPVVHLVEENFRNLDRVLTRLEIVTIDKALFDLGWSGYQLSDGRGFSFQGDEPLLMTYGNPEATRTAAEIVNSATEAELSDIIFTYGEERFARKIAKAIVTARAKARILTTAELVAVIESTVPAWYRGKRLHPATKTFQALRIAVNDELGALSDGISAAIARLAPKGRVAVITFHSIEDRAVKHLMRDAEAAGKGTVITKKVIAASREETLQNPRARSAKLRIFEGIESPYSNETEATEFSYA